MSLAAVSDSPLSSDPRKERALLSVVGVSKRFGPQAVLRSVSCDVSPGEVLLLLGANGAGKSTLLRLCARLLRADAGTIQNFAGKGSLGYVGHEPMLYPHLTVLENLCFFAALRGASRKEAQILSAAALECWGLTAHAHKQVAELSRGLQMRCSLARTLQAKPNLILLDEPTSALDEKTVAGLRSVLSDVASTGNRGGAVVMATHDIERVRSIATRVILLADGRIEADSAKAAHAGDHPAEACERVIALYRKENR